MATKNILILTYGLPRSGKSTWAKTTNIPTVNPDSIRLAIHGQPFVASAEPLVWATAKIMVNSLFLAGHNKVILDATNLRMDKRREWRSPDWEIEFKIFNTSKEICVQRALDNNQDYLVAVIERMAKGMEIPNRYEGELYEG